MSVNPEDQDVDFAFPTYFLPSFVLMRTKLMQKLNRNLTEEENATQCLKILTQMTTEDENELAEREVFPKTINERILRQ